MLVAVAEAQNRPPFPTGLKLHYKTSLTGVYPIHLGQIFTFGFAGILLTSLTVRETGHLRHIGPLSGDDSSIKSLTPLEAAL